MPDFWQEIVNKIGVDAAIAVGIFAVIIYFVLDLKEHNDAWQFKLFITSLVCIPLTFLLVYPFAIASSNQRLTSPSLDVPLIGVIFIIFLLTLPLIYYRARFRRHLSGISGNQKTIFSKGMQFYLNLFLIIMSTLLVIYLYGTLSLYPIMLLHLGLVFLASSSFYLSFLLILYLTHTSDSFEYQWKKSQGTKVLYLTTCIFFIFGLLVSYWVLFPKVTLISKDVTSVEILDYRYNNYNSEKGINEPLTSLTNNTRITYEIKPKYIRWIIFNLSEQIVSELSCALPYNSHASCKGENDVATISFNNEPEFNVTFSGKSRAYISSDVALIESKSKNEYGLSIFNTLPFKVERKVIGVEVNSKCNVTDYTYYMMPVPSEYLALAMGAHSIKDFSSREIISTTYISAVRDGNVTSINAIDVPPMSNLSFSFRYTC